MINETLEKITSLIFYETKIPKKVNYIIVLWSNYIDTMIDVKRIYDEWISKKIIITGWSYMWKDSTDSEAERFMNRWVELWIDKKDIILEKKASNTKENILFIKKILDKNNFKKWKILFVCKAFHTRRVLMTAQKNLWSNNEYYFLPIVDDTKISKNEWFLSEKSKNRVLAELIRIWEYTIKWDISF